MDNEYSADFIQYYKDRSEDGNSYKDLWQLNKEYDAIDAKLASQHGMKVESLDLKMKDVSKEKTLDTTAARDATREEYKDKADKIARQHGFQGKSYDEHLKEKKAQKGQTQSGKPDDDKEPPPGNPSGGKTAPKTPPTKEEQRQAFMQQMRDAGKGLTKDKERER